MPTHGQFAPALTLLALSRSCLSQAGHSRQPGALVVPHRRCRVAREGLTALPAKRCPLPGPEGVSGGIPALPRPGRASPRSRVPPPPPGPRRREPPALPEEVPQPRGAGREPAPTWRCSSRRYKELRLPHLPLGLHRAHSRSAPSAGAGAALRPLPCPVPSRPAERGSSRSRAAGGDGLFL